MNLASSMERATWLSSLVRLNTASKVVGFTERLVLRIRSWGITEGLGVIEPLLHMEHVGAQVKESGPLQLCGICVERANSQRSVDMS